MGRYHCLTAGVGKLPFSRGKEIHWSPSFFLLLMSQKKKMAKRWESSSNGCQQAWHVIAHMRPVGLPKLLVMKTDQQAGSGASACLLFLLPAHVIQVNGMLLWQSVSLWCSRSLCCPSIPGGPPFPSPEANTSTRRWDMDLTVPQTIEIPLQIPLQN